MIAWHLSSATGLGPRGDFTPEAVKQPLGIRARTYYGGAMTFKFAIFDLDGTLIDSRDIIHRAMIDTFERHQLPPPSFDDVRQVVGLGLHEACRRLAPGLEAPDLEPLVETYRNAFVRLRAAGQGFEPLYPGAKELVEQLASDNWVLGIATGKARRGIEAFYDQHGLQRHFTTSWCADDGPGKPHPFMVEEAMKAVGADAEQSLIIGDAVFDIQMGRAAGIRTLGVSWGFGRADELEAVGADEIHHAFDSLSDSLSAFSQNAMS